MTRIRTLIADDEPLARRRIRALLRPAADIDVIAEASDGEQTLRAIRELLPQLVFLDIQMPGMDGFTVLDSLDSNRLPLIIFVTAFDQYAVRAFEARALDYLLKPFTRSRFDNTLARVRERLQYPVAADLRECLALLLADLASPEHTHGMPLAVRTGSRTVLLDRARIDWVEAERDYIRIHTGPDTYLTRETMNRFEARLGSEHFVRVHRSTIVNLGFIREIHPLVGGDHVLVLRDGRQVTLSRGYRERLERVLRQGF
ncbi:MAG TPA: response regulator [Bryobacteraceae bacterium]|nr:response regulator [Bryobacteraceae bacterium]